MALHRDIHWIGRQWAVTGYGMQLIDQKLKGFFDIETIRLWDDGLIEAMHAKEWLNKADFDKGLAIARARYPGSPREPGPQDNVAQPLETTVLPAPTNGHSAPMPQAAKAVEPKPKELKPVERKREEPKPEEPKPEEAKPQKPEPIVAVAMTTETKNPAALGLKLAPAVPPKPAVPWFHVQFTGSAKFVRPWRVMLKR
jgi:hypothetical protein